MSAISLKRLIRHIQGGLLIDDVTTTISKHKHIRPIRRSKCPAYHGCQIHTSSKSPLTDDHNGAGDINTCKTQRFHESPLLDFCYAVGYQQVLDFHSIHEQMASIEERIAHRKIAILNITPSSNVGDIHPLKSRATIKCIFVNNLNRFRNLYASQVDLAFKCLAFNSYYSISFTIIYHSLRNYDISRITLQIATSHSIHARNASDQHR